MSMTVSMKRAFATLCLAVFACSAVHAEDRCGKLASIQNDVETRKNGDPDWAVSILGEELFALDRVRTGEASRAAILYSDQTLHRINEKSEVEVMPPEAGDPGVLRVISGQHYFSSRKPKDYGRIETPTVTAAIRGTEFVVDVAPGGATTITMIEGVVDASNDYGGVQVTAGEAAYVEPGSAPVKRVVVRPRDAVSWSLYYPRVLGGADAIRLSRAGESGRGLIRAAESLSAGQVELARSLIDQARTHDPNNPVALAMASVIELAEDRKDEGRRLARRAMEADDESAAAALAMSFAYQADFDIGEAREMAERAARLDPENAELLARVAELRMAQGDTDTARDAAERAVRRDPDSARALTVLGFVRLAELKTGQALDLFARAVAADPAFPLARLGHGIALSRRNVAAGREEMQTAVILDPENALFRSYLAKAYYEERRKDEALKELALAKQLDPSDPTPYLYDALVKRTYNRPVEALKEIQKSIELNDKRAVYRSRLLLDQDLAVRSADLAGTYNELGFNRLGMVTARRSADIDQSNFSSHLFLAGTYRELPRFAPAFLSETLQAQIYQPVNVNAVRPDVVNETISFNEYTALINRNRIRGFASVNYGQTDAESDLDPAVAPFLEVTDSSVSGGRATFTMNQDRFAGAISYETFQDDGFRINNDVEDQIIRGYFAFAPTYRDQFQLRFIDGSRDGGDLPVRARPYIPGIERVDTDLTNVGLGYRRVVSPAADLAVSLIYNDTTQTFSDRFTGNPGASAQLEGPQIEAQYVFRQPSVMWTVGAGHFDGEQTSDPVGPSATLTGDDKFSNAYVYAKLHHLGPVQLTAGASYEDLVAPVGFLPPRDSGVLAGEVQYEDDQISPKLGLSIQGTRTTVIRATAYRRLTPAIGRLQTLEPTQVSGFNQFFDDPAGTSSDNYGLGLDQQFSGSFFGGFSVLRRNLDIPEPTCANPDPTIGCGFAQPASQVVERNSDDWIGVLYLNGTVINRFALSVDYAYEQRDFDFTQVDNLSFFEDSMETHRVRPRIRFFLPMGFFAGVQATYYDQTVDQFSDLSSAERTPIESDFWIGDIELGYRLPKRWGSVSLRAFNVTDESFDYFRSSLEETVLPTRTVLLNFTFTSP